MPSSEPYRETHRMQRATFLRLARIFAVVGLPAVAYLWLVWRPLAGVAFGVAWAGFAAVFWLARWQLAVREDGLYYRMIPFKPVWSTLVAGEETVAVTVDHEANGREVLEAEGRLFPWSSGNRVIAMDFEGGVRIERADGDSVFISSRSPEALADALRSVSQ